MKTWNIIVRLTKEDKFDLDVPKKSVKFFLDFSKQTIQAEPLRTNIFDVLDASQIVLPENSQTLVYLALSVYTTDQLVSREGYGYQGWSRHFRLYFPVNAISKWQVVKDDLEKLLSFLSGDRWEIEFRKGSLATQARNGVREVDWKKVALFSGGLDSFTSAIEQLEKGRKVCFVSHYKSTVEQSIQNNLYTKLAEHYGVESFIAFQVFVRPNRSLRNASKERSSRARSFLFLALGIAFASFAGREVEFIVPENGFISLNVPLTSTRLGSHSSRTTHPYYIGLLRSVMTRLNIDNILGTPYQFETKGEMMMRMRANRFFTKLYKDTISCSHPEQSRYSKKKPGIHCGYCIPCIIRQAAELASGVNKTEYLTNIITNPPDTNLQSGSDLRAFKIGLERYKDISPRNIPFTILTSGPIPVEGGSLQKYVKVYKQGMTEVDKFLSKKK